MTCWNRLVPVVLVVTLGVSVAWAQPRGERGGVDERPPPPRDRETADGRAPDAEALRERIERMIVFAERIVEKNAEALAMLDGGADPEAVIEALRTPEFGRARHAMSPLTRREVSPDRLDPETMRRVRRYIKDHIPRLDEPLTSIEQVGPEGARRLVAKLAPRIMEIMEIQDRDPAQARLKLVELTSGLDILEHARVYRLLTERGGGDDELRSAREQLRVAVERRFDAQIRLKELEIERLSERVGRLRASLTGLKGERDAQIARQVEAATVDRPARGGGSADD